MYRRTTFEGALRARGAQRHEKKVLSNSFVLGFPYADVPEMGASVIAVTNDDEAGAKRMADELARALWSSRDAMRGKLQSVDIALELCRTRTDERICLLDMGDNVGGGSAGDGTTLVRELFRRRLGPSYACIYDPEAVVTCDRAGPGASLATAVGGKTDGRHGDPLQLTCTVLSLHDGRFQESAPRHGGIACFDQGRTAIVHAADSALTLMLTSRRMVPFSLRQLTSCGLDPWQFRVIVAKGVHAPLAAYREVATDFIRVNTQGATCADLAQIEYHHRRTPLFPWETASHW